MYTILIHVHAAYIVINNNNNYVLQVNACNPVIARPRMSA